MSHCYDQNSHCYTFLCCFASWSTFNPNNNNDIQMLDEKCNWRVKTTTCCHLLLFYIVIRNISDLHGIAKFLH